jgi:hypothetical protein
MRRTRRVQIDITPEARESIDKMDGDIQALTGMVHELIALHYNLIGVIKGEIAVEVSRASGDPVDGIKVFEGDEPPGEPVDYEEVGPAENSNGEERPKLPEAMTAQSFEDTSHGDSSRRRSSPWTRTPRHVQVEWLKKRMADGAWYGSAQIAREEATDERHHRYLRHAVGGRLKEMHDEGIVERRDSHVKGSMFEYRLLKKEEA